MPREIQLIRLLFSGYRDSRCCCSKPIRMDTLAFLSDLAPGFGVRGCQVKVLSEPSDFFSQLCWRAERSRERIAIAALYLGTGDKAESLVEAVRKSLQSGHTRTTFLLDHCRGNRLVGPEGKSSCTMLRPLLRDFQVSTYHVKVISNAIEILMTIFRLLHSAAVHLSIFYKDPASSNLVLLMCKKAGKLLCVVVLALCTRFGLCIKSLSRLTALDSTTGFLFLGLVLRQPLSHTRPPRLEEKTFTFQIQRNGWAATLQTLRL